ncbi:MAG: thiol protease/hemagglutinin PrtT [Saprospiraceae bacterium]|nr:thiol protease/hemagglutinin PrtT [Saprospiraceae bacterium]
MIKKFTTLLGMLLLLIQVTFAQQIDLNTALTVAENCFHEVADLHGLSAKSNTSLTHAQTITTHVNQNEVNLYFVFTAQEENGYVIVSADERVQPVLAYSLTAPFIQESENQPEAYRKWMRYYQYSIQEAIRQEIPASAEIEQAWEMYLTGDLPKDGEKVDPLTSTTWDQPFPYNALCPQDPNTGQRAVVGCVATAMAQIMRYHAHPAQGTGFHSYNHPTFGTVSANFGGTSYNWGAMPNAISNYNEQVARLSFHCGVSIEMGYGVDVSGVSSLSPVSDALKQYFSYSSTTQFVDRENYSDAAWLQLMKTELDNSRPIEYGGIGQGGGHAWVCDGYDNSNFFHMNWGWGGYQDGYFTLNALNPSTGGTGAGDSGFNYYQQAVIGIQPADGNGGGGGGNEPDPNAYSNLAVYSNISINPYPIDFAQPFDVSVDIANLGNAPVTGDLSAAIFTEDGTFIEFVNTESGTLDNGFFYSLTFSNDGLPTSPGTYLLALFFRPTNGEWTLIPAGNFQNTITIEIQGPYNEIQLYDDIQASPSPIVQNEPFNITVDYANFGSFNYSGEFSMDLYTLEGDYVAELDIIQADLCSNCHFTDGLTFSSNGIDVEPGTYLIATWNRPAGGSWQIVGTGDFTNPIQVVVKAPSAQPDIYENNDDANVAYPFDLSFSGNNASISTNGANMHDADDADYFAIDLLEGYSYTITPRAHDSYNSGNGQSYTNDVLYSVYSDGAWSEVFDDVVNEPFIINGGQTIYVAVSSYFVGTLGTYQLDVDVQRALGTAVKDLQTSELIEVFPNPTTQFTQLKVEREQAAEITYQLIHINGQVLETRNLGIQATLTQNIDLSAYANGTYILLVTVDGQSYRERIILNR